MVQTEEQKLKLLRPAILLLTLALAIFLVVGVATGQNSEPQENDDCAGSNVVSIPSQYGASNSGNESVNVTAEAENTQALIAIGAGAIPGWFASRIPPAEALRYVG